MSELSKRQRSGKLDGRLAGVVLTLWSLPISAAPPEPDVVRAVIQTLGRDTWTDLDAARQEVLLRQGCKQGSALICALSKAGRVRDWRFAEDLPLAAVCEAGDTLACLVESWRLTLRTPNAKTIPQDTPHAAPALAAVSRGCEGGLLRACAEQGIFHSHGIGTPRDQVKAGALYTRSCDGGDLFGCQLLSTVHHNGWGVPKDGARAVQLVLKGCEAGHPASCVSLASITEGEQADKDVLLKSIDGMRTACDGGDAYGCFYLGIMYAQVVGDGVKSVEVFRKACESGRMDACAYLGLMYVTGPGIEQDQAKAIEHCRTACEGDEMTGCAYLAHSYAGGLGVEKDEAKGAELYRRACDRAGVGCEYLGLMYSDGRGVEKDDAKGTELYR